MNQWPAELLFLLTGVLSGLSGAAAEAKVRRRITPADAMLACAFYGCLGSALAMFAYSWLGGKEHPEIIVGSGMLVGLRLIKPTFIVEIIKRILRVEDKP